MRPGVVSMPHGYGMDYQGEVVGPAANRLTSAGHRDPITATPYHKVVPARVERVTTPRP
jgi:anaerobic selenocysteine-containing dehydrogenase